MLVDVVDMVFCDVINDGFGLPGAKLLGVSVGNRDVGVNTLVFLSEMECTKRNEHRKWHKVKPGSCNLR